MRGTDPLTDADDALRAAVAALAGPSNPGSSDALLRAITARMPAMLLLIDPAGRIVWINRTNPGVTIAETLGRSLFEYAEPADHADPH